MMAGSNAHTSLQMVRASGEGAATSMGNKSVSCHGGHMQTRCALSKVLMDKDSNGRRTPTYCKPNPPVLTSMSSNATRDAARTSVAPPALASRVQGRPPHACGLREGLQKNGPQSSTLEGRAHSMNRSPPYKHSPVATRQCTP